MLGMIEGKRMGVGAEDELVGWYHLHNAHEFEKTLGDDEGQGSLEYCSSQSHKQSDIEMEKQQ